MTIGLLHPGEMGAAIAAALPLEPQPVSKNFAVGPVVVRATGTPLPRRPCSTEETQHLAANPAFEAGTDSAPAATAASSLNALPN
jgi:hypothetical protein